MINDDKNTIRLKISKKTNQSVTDLKDIFE